MKLAKQVKFGNVVPTPFAWLRSPFEPQSGASSPPPPAETYNILQETGDKLLQEDGGSLLTEESASSNFLLEDGTDFLLEDGTTLLLEAA